MPSASAKLEKQASTEALDPLKQILTMMEKKVRNLEKRKVKLDTYKSEFNSGKELNEDQKTAITKYDQVVEILEFAKELQKSFCTIVQDNVKLQKKAAKREHVERQQQEIQRLKEILLVQDVLVSMGLENVRSDFLKGINGAMQMSEEELNQLDEIYKLVSVDHDSEEENGVSLDDQLSSAAEHLSALLEAKNKEVIGTTYKHLKDIILKIHVCGYFSHSENQEEEVKDDELHTDENAKGDARKCGEGEEFVEEEDYDPTNVTEIVQSGEGQQEEEALVMQTTGGDRSQVERPYFAVSSTTSDAPPYTNQNHSLQEVLPMQGSFNFLQESQIDLESPHMDPAVVVAHPIVPPPSMGYPGSQYPSTSQSAPSLSLSVQQHQRQGVATEEGNLGGHATPAGIPSAVSSTQVQQQPPSAAMTAGAPVALTQNPVNPPPDFDPSRPIPTQTFTNQNFAAAIHPMMAAAAVVPPSYVPVTISHGNIPQHMIAVGMVPPTVSPRGTPTPPPVSSSTSPLPMPVTSQGMPSTTGQGVNLTAQQETKDPFGNEFQIHQASLDGGSSHAAQVSVSQSSLGASSSQYQQVDDTPTASGGFSTQSQGSNFGQVRTGYGSNSSNRGNRARGSPNGFSRGSGRNSYGNGRTSRGGTGGRGGTSRGGRGSYRAQ